MRVAYVGDFINHGTSLQTPGTSLVILLSGMENVTSVDVYCPEINRTIEDFKNPGNVKIISFYKYNNPLSIFKLLGVSWKSYDSVIFNMLPTGFGKSSISNATALAIPLVLTKLLKMNNVKVIYHNSTFTLDVKALGYDSLYNRIRSFFLGKIEKALFRNIPTYVLLDLYKKRIDKAIGANRVSVLNFRYLDAVSTIYINNLMNAEILEFKKNETPVILLHGYWGPQKNIEMALSSLSTLRKRGIKFKLTVSGGINNHFPSYEAKFKKLLEFYPGLVDKYLGYVKEKDILNIFLKSDLLILPYNTPGGISGVLEQGIFFDLRTIAIDFPEYREQSRDISIVKLVSKDDFLNSIYEQFRDLNRYERIIIKDKIIEARKNLIKLLL